MPTQYVEYYAEDGAILEGYFAYDANSTTPRPLVLVSHDWSGRNQFACHKADQLVEVGYHAFALDMYGKGILGQDNEQKSQLIKPLVENRGLLRQRIVAALTIARTLPGVDPQRIGAIGFCFGGLCVLDLARSGADLKGVVSFHGLLHAHVDLKNEPIKAKVLALHGHDDPMVPPEQVALFTQEMTHAKIDWQLHIYGNTMHAFTNPQAHDAKFGTVYNATADRRSWLAMRNFFAELFV